MPDELDEAITDLATQLGVPVAELIRCGLGWVVRVAAFQAASLARRREGAPPARQRPICRMPRRPDPVGDALAHAQCDQLMQRFAKELSDVG